MGACGPQLTDLLPLPFPAGRTPEAVHFLSGPSDLETVASIGCAAPRRLPLAAAQELARLLAVPVTCPWLPLWPCRWPLAASLTYSRPPARPPAPAPALVPPKTK